MEGPMPLTFHLNIAKPKLGLLTHPCGEAYYAFGMGGYFTKQEVSIATITTIAITQLLQQPQPQQQQ